MSTLRNVVSAEVAERVTHAQCGGGGAMRFQWARIRRVRGVANRHLMFATWVTPSSAIAVALDSEWR